ncbi:MAG: MFS transporter, partial [Hyphomicrobiaceae bacterium]
MSIAEATSGAMRPATLIGAAAGRSFVIGLMAFLTVVDLFATQAILPVLAAAYGVSAAAMGTAMNASTIGMAISGLAVSLLSSRIDRQRGVVTSLAMLAIPTALLSFAPDLTTFTVLRIAQGLCMAAAFTLTLAYLAEETSGAATASAFAAYIAGNVASNLVGRMISATAADTLGLAANFYLFAALNVLGAALAYVTLRRMSAVTMQTGHGARAFTVWLRHLGNPSLRLAFAIGFLILFAFVGVFTYVNFVLVMPPISLGMMALGTVYLVFLPSMVTTPLAGRLASRCGVRLALAGPLLLAAAALPLLLLQKLPAVL